MYEKTLQMGLYRGMFRQMLTMCRDANVAEDIESTINRS